MATTSEMVLIVAGHYCISSVLSDLSHLAESELTSFRLGTEKYLTYRREGYQARLIVWVNDIGILPLERAKLQANYQLPDNYLSVLDEAEISIDDVVIRFESQSRNKASKCLRQMKRQYPQIITETSSLDDGLIRCVDNEQCSELLESQVLTINNDDGGTLVIKEGGAAKCCAILATFFSDLNNHFKPVKVIGIFNFIYIERIKAGMFVAQSLYSYTTPTTQIFNDGQHVLMTETYNVIKAVTE
jgi:hypothetical protein